MQNHHNRIRALHKGRYRHGKYIVNPTSESADSLIRWIITGGFTAYEKKQFHLSQAKGRLRNSLYSFYLPEMQQEVVMKVSHIHPRYRFSRKIDLFLTSLYKDYCKISFYGTVTLHGHSLPVARPLAFWTVRQSFFKKKSYFLCDKLPGEQSVSQLLQSPTTCDYRSLAEKLVAIIRNIHAAELRHGDLHTGNIYAHFPRFTPAKQTREMSEVDFYLLDYDNCSKTRIKTLWIKKIYDLKDLSLLTIPTVSDEELLQMYFGKPPSSQALRIFRFWKNGGINLRKQLGLPPKKENRHLAH